MIFTGKPFNAQALINNAVSNIICCLVFGERYEYSDKQYQQILQDINEIMILQGGFAAQVSFFINRKRRFLSIKNFTL